MNNNTTKTSDKIQIYADAIKAAQIAANEANQPEDGGTCNMDSVVIDFTGWRDTAIQQVAALSGISIGDKLSSWMWKGSCFINFNVNGQGNNRSRMVEAAHRKLKELEIPASVYYQMD